jgi:fucose permease
MIILMLLRRMSPRARMITGWALMALGAVVALATPFVHYDLYVHGAILAGCGIIFLGARNKQFAPKRSDARHAKADSTRVVSQ